MTTSAVDSTARKSVNDDGTTNPKPAAPLVHPNEPPIPNKTKTQNIRVSAAVLDAARKDGEALLRDLKTSLVGLSQVEADERMRKTGPNEIAQERKQGW